MFSDSTEMPSIETFMTFLLALTLLEISRARHDADYRHRADVQMTGIPGYILRF